MNSHLKAFFLACIATAFVASALRAEFTTVINVPPNILSQSTSVGAGTQLNLLNGSGVQVFVEVFDGGEINVLGGVNSNGLFVGSNGTVNIGGGNSNLVNAGGGGVVNFSNGSVDWLNLNGSTLNMTGGAVAKTGSNIRGRIDISNGTTANFSGGAFGQIYDASSGTTTNFFGGEFRHNGTPITGLENVGDSLQLDMTDGSIVTGTLADGTPFQLSEYDLNRINPSGVLHLIRTALPAAPANVAVPADSAPRGSRPGQTVSIASGGVLANSFRAGWNSTVNIGSGATIGNDFAALANSTVNMSGGTIGEFSTARMGSIVNITGGSIGRKFSTSSGSVVNISGGSVATGFEVAGTANITGGNIANVTSSQGMVTVSGGTVGGFSLARGISLVGGEFRLNDVPISGLDNVGDSLQFQVPSSALLTGTYADGTPFIFGSEFSGGVRLQRAAVPDVGPPVINVPASPAPYGTRAGQTVVVGPGGTLGPTFQAGRGGILKVEGGAVGTELKMVNATVEMSSGSIGQNARAFQNSRFTMTGGTLGANFVAYSGSQIDIAGGSVGSSLLALIGSTVNISGGAVGSLLTVNSGAKLNISGGTINTMQLNSGSVTNISGGQFGRSYFDFLALTGSVTNMFAQQFLLNGAPIPGLQIGVPFTIANKTGTLTGTFSNGTPFSIVLFTPSPDPRGGAGQGFFTGSTLTLTLVPEPSALCAFAIGTAICSMTLRHRRNEAVL